MRCHPRQHRNIWEYIHNFAFFQRIFDLSTGILWNFAFHIERIFGLNTGIFVDIYMIFIFILKEYLNKAYFVILIFISKGYLA